MKFAEGDGGTLWYVFHTYTHIGVTSVPKNGVLSVGAVIGPGYATGSDYAVYVSDLRAF